MWPIRALSLPWPVLAFWQVSSLQSDWKSNIIFQISFKTISEAIPRWFFYDKNLSSQNGHKLQHHIYY